MPADLRIEGSRDLERIARKLKETGDKELRKELYRGIQRATKQAKTQVKEAARRDLPKRGGLNEFIAKASLATKTRSAGKNPGVTIVAKKSGHDIKAIDRGRVRHPVFGNKKTWVLQQVKPGFFSVTLMGEAEHLRQELLKVLEDVANKIR